jgi:hypothetical protein
MMSILFCLAEHRRARVQVFDWNKIGKSDLAGEIRIDEKKVLEILSGATDEKTEIQMVLLDNGKRVVGYDKQECVVSLEIYALDREEVRFPCTVYVVTTRTHTHHTHTHTQACNTRTRCFPGSLRVGSPGGPFSPHSITHTTHTQP